MGPNRGQSTRARGRGGIRPPATTHNGAPYPPSHEGLHPMPSMEPRGHAQRPRLSQAGLDIPMPGPVPADSTPVRGSPSTPVESESTWSSSCRRRYSSSEGSASEGFGPQRQSQKRRDTEKSDSQCSGDDEDRAWARDAHCFRLVDFVHSQDPDLPRAGPEEVPMEMRPVPLPFHQPLWDPFGGLPIIFPFVLLPWTPYEELLVSDSQSRDLSLTESLMKAAMEAQVRHEAIVASAEAAPAKGSSRSHHEKQSPEKEDKTEVVVGEEEGGEEAPAGGDWEADYLDVLRNPDHPFWTITPVQLAECPNPRLPGTHFLAVDPAHQPWVSVIELVLRNFMSYSKGYRNYQPVPSAGQEGRDPEADKNEETHAQFLGNSCLVPYLQPSIDNSHPRLAHETGGAPMGPPTARAFSPSRPHPGMSMGSPTAPVFRPRQEQPATNMGPPTAPVFHPRQQQQGASLIPTAPEFHPPQARPGMTMGPPVPAFPRQPNPEMGMSGPGMTTSHQPVPGVPPPHAGPGMYPVVTGEGRTINPLRPVVPGESGVRFPGPVPTPAVPQPLRPLQGVPSADPDRLGYLGMTRAEQTGMQSPRLRLVRSMPVSGPGQLGVHGTTRPGQMGVQALPQRPVQNMAAPGYNQLGHHATNRPEQMGMQPPREPRQMRSMPAAGPTQLGTTRPEQMAMRAPLQQRRQMRNMPAAGPGQPGHHGTIRPEQEDMQTVPLIRLSPIASSSNNLQHRVALPLPRRPNPPPQTSSLQPLGGPPVPADNSQSRNPVLSHAHPSHAHPSHAHPSHAHPPPAHPAPTPAQPAPNPAPGKKVSSSVKRKKLQRHRLRLASRGMVVSQATPQLLVQPNRPAPPPVFRPDDFPALPGTKDETEEEATQDPKEQK